VHYKIWASFFKRHQIRGGLLFSDPLLLHFEGVEEGHAILSSATHFSLFLLVPAMQAQLSPPPTISEQHESRRIAPMMRSKKDTSTTTSARHKKQRKNKPDNRQQRQSMVDISQMEFMHQRAHEQFMSNYYHPTRSSPAAPRAAPLFGNIHPRTPVRPPLAHRQDALISPPMPQRVTQQQQQKQFRQPALPYPVQYRRGPVAHNNNTGSLSMVGNPNLGIYRIRLPLHLLHLLDQVVLGCEAHASTLATGWRTALYSLTKQDIALRQVPATYQTAQPIVAYIQKCMMKLWRVSSVSMDRNQPHILKYDESHLGVELHHDKCDITANLCLSRTTSYVGGGYVISLLLVCRFVLPLVVPVDYWLSEYNIRLSLTYPLCVYISTSFPDARAVVRLDFGEFILHPGSLVHGGMPISSGTRHLMVIFAHVSNK
jgi:hypothetical protein